MDQSWPALVRDLEAETERIATACPDEIKRFHYGLMTHSDAGKYALNQYYGHWVHTYAEYYYYGTDVLPGLRRLAQNPACSLEMARVAFREFSREWPASLAEYSGQTGFGRYLAAVLEALDTLETKAEFEQLVVAYQTYVTRLYWWMHWYFPWGIGAATCQRRSAADVAEIIRLSPPT